MPSALQGHDARTSPDSSLGVHVLAGLPTAAVRRGFEQASDLFSVVPLAGLAEVAIGDATQIGVLLPPFVEPSQIIESWEACDFLPYRFGRPAYLAGVWAFLDVDHLADHLASAAPLSRRGWGRSNLDHRTVADIVVEQIEFATHLVHVGAAPVSRSLARCLTVLNPGATRIPFHDGSPGETTELVAALRAVGDRGVGEPADRRDPKRPGSSAAGAGFGPVVPPWLEVLQSESDPPPGSGVHVYRRTRPFDPNRLARWLEEPPNELVRGKGHVWLASEPDQRLGYSCAGSVHRLFRAGRWWASQGGSHWPRCEVQRRRLLERWHPRFGDRRQEFVFAGVDLDFDRLCAGLDACLLAEEAIDDSLLASGNEGVELQAKPRARIH